MSKSVKLVLNIGKPDCKRLGLKPEEALVGKVVTVEDEAAAEMLKHGWATEDTKDAELSKDAKPVGSADLKSTPGGGATAVGDPGAQQKDKPK